jgi:anti-sigma regulatory factor (Ser/Thr protein kinase)
MTTLTYAATVLLDTDDHGVVGVTVARHVAASWLADLAVPQEAVDTILLVASELLTNAVRHTTGHVRAAIGAHDDEIVVQVFDESLELPNPLLAKPDDPGGHGLAIVAALADRWGAEHVTLHGRTGKVVWASVRWMA